LRQKFRAHSYNRATDAVGGQTIRNEQIGSNEFGRTLSIDYLHIFNPQTRQDRARIVRNAYVPSKRRDQFVDEIDRVIRTALPVGPTDATLIPTDAKKTESHFE
jgi:hypothetical protein